MSAACGWVNPWKDSGDRGRAQEDHERECAVCKLRATSTDGLLQAFASLTHRMHECGGGVRAGVCDGPCTGLRAQRDQIRDEIKRRTGDL